ncbi:hypothetical protein [Massilia sp. TN1-12]|uniref:hypothetical protein n=1 Tax=Massilia paldalensis TaxID=3377675 RepID=UPI003850EDA2
MKSVTFSDIEPVRHRLSRPLRPSVRAQRLAPLALLLALGLPTLALVFHLVEPATPLGYIVLPVLAGGVLPLLEELPGRLEVSTRFHACHLVGTLDETMEKLGYIPAERSPGTVRYRSRARRWARLPQREVAVTVLDHALEVTGPVPALRALRKRLAC